MSTKVIAPTAYNFLTHINKLLVQRKRDGLVPVVETESLRERAKLMLEESSPITVTEG